MVEIIGVWEKGWLDPKLEAFMWKQVINAHKVDKFIMTPKLLFPERVNVIQYNTIEEALKNIKGKKVFVLPNNRVKKQIKLFKYQHPKDACYIFGSAGENLIRFIEDDDDVITIPTPVNTDMFAISVVNTILYERRQ